MVAEITGCGEDAATDAVSRADGDVKIASLMALGVDRVTAETVLDRNGDDLRRAFAELGRED
jgi:N-acetylmuramic acid 6-phosphate etherase